MRQLHVLVVSAVFATLLQFNYLQLHPSANILFSFLIAVLNTLFARCFLLLSSPIPFFFPISSRHWLRC